MKGLATATIVLSIILFVQAEPPSHYHYHGVSHGQKTPDYEEPGLSNLELQDLLRSVVNLLSANGHSWADSPPNPYHDYYKPQNPYKLQDPYKPQDPYTPPGHGYAAPA